MKIGVLALQGDFKEHIEMLKKCKVSTKEVRLSEDLKNIDGLIIPGGESTTIGNLLVKTRIDKGIIKMHKKGMPIYGTCAGAILLARKIENSSQPRLRLMDIEIKRNDYGRQVDSFEAELEIEKIGKFNGVFIRAPVIKNAGSSRVFAKLNGSPVLVQQDNLLASTFHPELTNDARLHKYFIEMVRSS